MTRDARPTPARLAPARLAATVLVTACVLGALAGTGVTAFGAGVHAREAGSCHISPGRQESFGPTYVTSISVSGGASCRQAERLVRSYYHCRLKQGGVKGTCSGVEGFGCREHRYAEIKVQFDASVQCTRGRERVAHDFTQFT
jgi:hypothetical protein